MAGIGFVLQKLTSRGDLLGLAQGYAHASISSSGGWLFTIVTLSLITFFGPSFATYSDLSVFRLTSGSTRHGRSSSRSRSRNSGLMTRPIVLRGRSAT